MTKEKKSPKRGKSVTDKVKRFDCEYCGASFAREETIMRHTCVRGEREREKTSKKSIAAFRLYTAFMKRKSNKRVIDWEDFVTSKFYNDFHRVGSFMIEQDVIAPLLLTNYYIDSGLPIRDWATQATYQKYLTHLLRTETPTSAIDRNINLMVKWAEENGENWVDFFDKVSPNRAVVWLQSGRLSPWLIYMSPRSNALLSRFNKQHWDLVSRILDPSFWEIRMTSNMDEVTRIQGLLKGYGL